MPHERFARTHPDTGEDLWQMAKFYRRPACGRTGNCRVRIHCRPLSLAAVRWRRKCPQVGVVARRPNDRAASCPLLRLPPIPIPYTWMMSVLGHLWCWVGSSFAVLAARAGPISCVVVCHFLSQAACSSGEASPCVPDHRAAWAVPGRVQCFPAFGRARDTHLVSQVRVKNRRATLRQQSL